MNREKQAELLFAEIRSTLRSEPHAMELYDGTWEVFLMDRHMHGEGGELLAFSFVGKDLAQAAERMLERAAWMQKGSSCTPGCLKPKPNPKNGDID